MFGLEFPSFVWFPFHFDTVQVAMHPVIVASVTATSMHQITPENHQISTF